MNAISPIKPLTALAGDVGGTHVRFAIASRSEGGEITLDQMKKFPVKVYGGFALALADYLKSMDGPRPDYAAIACAGPKFSDHIQMTNFNWLISESELRDNFRFKNPAVINDWVGMARGIVEIPPTGLQSLIGGALDTTKNIAALGPGTGMGVSCLVPCPNGGEARVFATEGGHVGFAPQTALGREVLMILAKERSYVSAEDVLSGPGFLRLYEALCQIWDVTPILDDETQIISAGESNPDSAARRTIDIFCNMLGSFAGNSALILGASGGVVLGGGVTRHIAPFLSESDFASHFHSRGSGSWFVKDIPVKIITTHGTALYGAASAAFDAAEKFMATK